MHLSSFSHALVRTCPCAILDNVGDFPALSDCLQHWGGCRTWDEEAWRCHSPQPASWCYTQSPHIWGSWLESAWHARVLCVAPAQPTPPSSLSGQCCDWQAPDSNTRGCVPEPCNLLSCLLPVSLFFLSFLHHEETDLSVKGGILKGQGGTFSSLHPRLSLPPEAAGPLCFFTFFSGPPHLIGNCKHQSHCHFLSFSQCISSQYLIS